MVGGYRDEDAPGKERERLETGALFPVDIE